MIYLQTLEEFWIEVGANMVRSGKVDGGGANRGGVCWRRRRPEVRWAFNFFDFCVDLVLRSGVKQREVPRAINLVLQGGWRGSWWRGLSGVSPEIKKDCISEV